MTETSAPPETQPAGGASRHPATAEGSSVENASGPVTAPTPPGAASAPAAGSPVVAPARAELTAAIDERMQRLAKIEEHDADGGDFPGAGRTADAAGGARPRSIAAGSKRAASAQ